MKVDTDVLVVGAGPTGLAAAIELGMRGIKVLIIDRNSRTGTSPRAKTTNVRTRTHLRRWGIADRLAKEAPFGIHYPSDMVFVTRLAGRELARFENAFNTRPERSALYPEHGQWVPQYTLEKVLLDKVLSLSSVAIGFGVTFKSAEQRADCVTAIVEGEGGSRFVTCRYLLGADGAHSRVREVIGATMEGRRGIHFSYNIIFRAPGLAEAHHFGPASIYWQIGSDGFSTIGPMDRGDIWFFMPGGAAPGTSLSKEEAKALIARRTGIDLPYQILSADSWTANELLADRYRGGRIFLAGDACHLHPPAGGYGMNMGIGDGVDLGWKLAATLQGWGGPKLLASYEVERRPVHKAVIQEAMTNFEIYIQKPPVEIEADSSRGELARTDLGRKIREHKGREFYTLGTVLGLGYEESPVIIYETECSPGHRAGIYEPTARPGHLLPHAWLSEDRALYDLLGSGYSLIAASTVGQIDIDAVQSDARALKIPLTVIQPDEIDVSALNDAPLVLVRPDQQVAWRGDRWTNVFPVVSGQSSLPASLAGS